MFPFENQQTKTWIIDWHKLSWKKHQKLCGIFNMNESKQQSVFYEEIFNGKLEKQIEVYRNDGT